MSTQSIIVATVAALVAIYAATKGGHPERWCAAIIFAGIVFDKTFEAAFGLRDFDDFDLSRLLLDSVQLFAFVGIALRANRLYPLGIASAQLLALIGSIAALVVHEGWNQAYWAMTQLPLFIQLALLSGGTHAHRLRVAKIGNYNGWSPIQTRWGDPA